MGAPPVTIEGLVPMAHVADLPRSIAFYGQLGLEVGGRWEHEGRLVWAELCRGATRLFISQADAPVSRTEQGVLFYLYSQDLVGLRAQLLASGLAPSEISHPPYMERGEFRIEDPDGYVLLIGQSDPA
jgi:catechol 2,3-dioxygenase-like lactoylglutathione lyase family enzyme